MSPAPSLPETQRRLRTVFTDPRGVAPNLDAAREIVHDGPPASLHDRLAVYCDAYFLRLSDSLAADFAAVRRALGADRFQRLAADYLQAHPPSSPNIGDAGERLPAFLGAHPFSAEHPFLPDLALLEWSILASLYTDRLPPLDPAAAEKTPADAWDRARLVLDPTVRLLAPAWAVERLWRRRAQPDARGERVLSKPSPRHLLLHRDDEWVQVRRISRPEFLVLQKIGEGIPLGEVCRLLDGETGPLPLQEWFRAWTESGVLKGIRI